MKIRKLIVTLLICLLSFSSSLLLFGCEEETTTELNSEVAAQLKDVYGDFTGQKLEVAVLDKGAGDEWIKDACRRFNAGTGSQITIKSDETLNESLATYLDAKTGYDVYFSFSAQIQWVRWALQDKIYCLDDLGLVYDESLEKIGVIDGKRYTMPYTYAPTGFIYNQEYIDEIPSYGEFTQGTFPTTWQGLLDLCESINNNWNKTVLGQQVVPMSWGGSVGDMKYIYYGLWAQNDPEGFNNYWNQTTTTVTNKSNESLLVNEGSIEALDAIAKLFNTKENSKGNYYPSNSFSDSTGHSNLIAEQKFLNGLSVFTISGSWFENEMREQIEENEIDFYHFAAVPKLNENNENAIFMNIPAEYFMIAKNGKNNNYELAKAFLMYLATEERCQTFQSYSGIPCAVKYKANISSLNGFVQEIAQVMENANCVVAASDQKASLSNAIELNMNSSFVKLATTQYSSNLAKEILESLYDNQYRNWQESMKNFE